MSFYLTRNQSSVKFAVRFLKFGPVVSRLLAGLEHLSASRRKVVPDESGNSRPVKIAGKIDL